MKQWLERESRNPIVIPGMVVADMMRRRVEKGRPELCLVWNGERSRATVSFVRPANVGFPKATPQAIVRSIATAIRSIFVKVWTNAQSRRTERA